MQALLSYDQSPPIGAPFRFFLTAPFFGILAGVLLLWSGEGVFSSRWAPSALALTHLIALGFMLQVMLGAMIQILPVVAGAHMLKPMWVTSVVHATLNLGTLLLAAAFLSYLPWLFNAAAMLLGISVIFFIGFAAHALFGVSSSTSTISGLKLSLVGLGVTVVLGVLLAVSLGGSLDLPVMQLADIHLGWGFVAWGTVLLAAVGYVVVPMFQLTPAYPRWLERRFSLSALVTVAVWSMAEWSGQTWATVILGTTVVATAALFAGVTLNIQRQSKRARFDATQHYWRGAMLSALAGCAVWLAARFCPWVGDWLGWSLLCGVFLIFGGFMSVIVGMLYKIVPFLIWLHLQNQGQGRVLAPNMKKMIAEKAMSRQMLTHFAACVLLGLAVFWPEWFVYPAGLALVVANGWLLNNLLSAMSVYRHHQLTIKSLTGI